MVKIRYILLVCVVLFNSPSGMAANFVETPYDPQKVVFEFYFDDPAKIHSALFWLRSLLNPLMAEPYAYAPEELEVVVVIHGTELVSLANKNYNQYKDAVDRMRYYADFGVQFKVCAIAMGDFGYQSSDLQKFVDVVPSAITELVHWQMKGYALIHPQVLEKKFSLEEIR